MTGNLAFTNALIAAGLIDVPCVVEYDNAPADLDQRVADRILSWLDRW